MDEGYKFEPLEYTLVCGTYIGYLDFNREDESGKTVILTLHSGVKKVIRWSDIKETRNVKS